MKEKQIISMKDLSSISASFKRSALAMEKLSGKAVLATDLFKWVTEELEKISLELMRPRFCPRWLWKLSQRSF